jgi:hypothetical protein
VLISDHSVIQQLVPASDLLVRSITFLLYVGPDQIMPLTSVLGAIVGIALMFWNRLVGFAVRSRAFFSRRAGAPPTGSD